MSSILEDHVVIDLSRLRKYIGVIVYEVPLEESLIELYGDHNLLDKFSHIVLKHTMMDDNIVYDYNKLSTFYNPKQYIDKVMYFLDTLEILVRHNLPPDIVHVVFDSYVDKNKLLVKFKVLRTKHGEFDNK